MILKTFYTLSLLMMTVTGFACQSDTDCNSGSLCIKTEGNISGACVGGTNPGETNNTNPVFSPSDPNNTTGNPCLYDSDCGPGSTCFKSSETDQGTCMAN